MTIINADVLEGLATLEAESVQCVVTSPPYWSLRNYGIAGQLGLEPTPEEYVAKMVQVFAEVWRVLRKDGTLWLNMGDSYTGANNTNRGGNANWGSQPGREIQVGRDKKGFGCKTKDLMGVPWRLAFALQAAGWYLRSDIIWHKPNPMPESVTDRPTKAHEYLFLMAKSQKYYYDQEAIREDYVDDRLGDPGPATSKYDLAGIKSRYQHTTKPKAKGRNKRTVWTIATQPYPEAHFATFPLALVEPCVLAGSRPGDLVLDPFFGSGTVGVVCQRLGRRWVGIELNPEYVVMATRRIENDRPNVPGLLNQMEANDNGS